MAARDAGYEVSVVTQVDRHGEPIRAQGLRLIPIRLSRQGTNPFQELALIVRLFRIYRRERPDIVYQVAMKPVIYGSLVARLTGVHGILNAMAGLGFLFGFRSLKARLLRPLVRGAFRLLLGGANTRVVLRNSASNGFRWKPWRSIEPWLKANELYGSIPDHSYP